MDDQNNTNNQNPINPLDQTQVDQNPKPTEEVININTQPIQNTPLEEQKTQENEDQNIETQGFPSMDSSTPPPPPIPTVEEILNEEQGTNSPNLDIPTVISTDNKPKKKFGGKTIATILGILLLLLGIGAGVILLNQQQEIRIKAGACCSPTGAEYELTCGPGLCCVNAGESACMDQPNPGYACKPCGGGGTTPTNPPSNPTKPPSSPNPPSSDPVVSCLNVKAYDTSWNVLTLDELNKLKTGDKVRFTVAGTATSGTFSKAKFTINTAVQPETTTKKPSTEEFYIEYTIPINVEDFSINAQIYHSTNGWI